MSEWQTCKFPSKSKKSAITTHTLAVVFVVEAAVDERGQLLEVPLRLVEGFLEQAQLLELGGPPRALSANMRMRRASWIDFAMMASSDPTVSTTTTLPSLLMSVRTTCT